MATTLGEMLERMQSELHVSSLTAEASAAVFSAIARYRNRPFWFTEGVATLTAVANSVDLSTLAGMEICMVQVHDGTNRPALDEKTYEELAPSLANGLSGVPSAYTLHASMLYLYPAPSATLTVVVSYAGTRSLSTTTTSASVWFQVAEELIRTAAKVDVAENVMRDFAQADRLRIRETQAMLALEEETERRLPNLVRRYL